MSINSENVTTGPYSGNGTTSTFSYDFPIQYRTELNVFHTDTSGVVSVLVVDTDYDLTGVGDPDGGTITLTGGPLMTGETLFIRSNRPNTQTTTYANNSPLFPETIGEGVDRLTVLVQQLNALALKMPPELLRNSTQNTLPTPSENYVLGWDATGKLKNIGFSVNNQLVNFDLLTQNLSTVVQRNVDTVALLRGVSVLTGQRVATLGYFSKDDGGKAEYYADLSDTTSIDNGGSIIVANDGTRWKLIQEQTLHVKQFGAKGDNVTNDYAAFLSCKTYVESLSSPRVIQLGNSRYKINTGLVLNPARVMLHGESATLNFSDSSTAYAIWWRGQGTAGESVITNASRLHMSGIKLIGTMLMVGLDVYSDTGTGDSRQLNFSYVTFDSFNKGIRLSNNGWGVVLENYAFVNCTTDIEEDQDNAPTVMNFGERNIFKKGMHTGSSGVAYKSRNYSSDAHFSDVSFDKPSAIDIAHGARVFITDAHIEPGSDSDTLFVVEGDISGLAQTYLSLKNSLITLLGSIRINPLFSCALNYSVGNGGIDIDNLCLQFSASSFNFQPKSLVVGTGRTNVKRLHTHYRFPELTVSPTLNMISNAGFESGSLGDWVAVDAGNPPTVATDFKRSGTYALKMVAVPTVIVGAKINRKVKPGQTALLSLWYKTTSVVANGASYKAFDIFVKCYDALGNVISTINEEVYKTGTTAGFVYYTSDVLRYTTIPMGADSLELSVQMYQTTTGGTAWVDDVVFNVID